MKRTADSNIVKTKIGLHGQTTLRSRVESGAGKIKVHVTRNSKDTSTAFHIQ